MGCFLYALLMLTFVAMFIKVIFRADKTTGRQVSQYRLCESYRIDNMVRHQTILHLGSLPELPCVEQKRALAIRINELVKQSHTGSQPLFAPEPQVERLALHFFGQIKEKERLDIAAGKDYHRIDTDTIGNKDVRETGAEWLCLQAMEQLGISTLLAQQGWKSEAIQLALTHLASRAVYPASELQTSRWIQQNSAICELTGYPSAKITKDKLYNITHRLYDVKDALEKHLGQRTNELFDLDDKIIIYDLTNTYFEGSMRNSQLAKFGRSKEKRSDARLIVLALVVNKEGFLKYSQIFEGNMADSGSLEKIIDELSIRTSATGRRPVVVMDAGISSEKNLALLKSKGFDYMCVSRSGLQKYKVDTTTTPVLVTDNHNQPITLHKATVAGSTDNWLQVYSEAKVLKESGMNNRFVERFELGLNQIKASINKKSGVKKQEKVWERIGRLKSKYASIGKHYAITTDADKKGMVTSIDWHQKPADKKEGYYLLRTTLNNNEELVQWFIYNTIREIEATFRVLKTDLDLRPVYHKTDQAAMAHLHLGLLAYWVVNTIRHQLKQKGISSQWKEIVRTMNTQKLVTTEMVNEYDQKIIIRQCSEPNFAVEKIYQALNYKKRPPVKTKSVVPLNPNKKNETTHKPLFCDG